MDADGFRDLFGSYAVGALDEKELKRFRDSLRRADEAEKNEVRDYLETAALLSLAESALPAPAYLKSRLLRQILSEVERPQFSKWREILTILKPSFPVLVPVTAAFLLALCIAGYLSVRLASLERERNELAKRLTDSTQGRDATQAKLDELVTRTTRLISLAGKETPQASARVFWDTANRHWVVYITGLPAPPDNKDYQLWYITRENAKVSVAVFRTNKNGTGEVSAVLPIGASASLTAAAVTIEPRGGSVQPTGGIQLVGLSGV